MTTDTKENWRTALIAIGLASLLVLAGCAGSSGGGGTTATAADNAESTVKADDSTDSAKETETKADTASPTPTPTGPQFAQTYVRNGAFDPDAVRSSHSSLATESSYSWSIRTVEGDTTSSVSYKQTGDEAFRVSTLNDETRKLYINNTAESASFRLIRDGEVVYTGGGDESKFNATGWMEFKDEMKVLQWSFDGYSERNGETVAVFTASKLMPGLSDEFNYEKNLSAKLVIGESGILYEFSATGVAEDGTDASGTFSLTYSASTEDVTVTEPKWTDE